MVLLVYFTPVCNCSLLARNERAFDLCFCSVSEDIRGFLGFFENRKSEVACNLQSLKRKSQPHSITLVFYLEHKSMSQILERF